MHAEIISCRTSDEIRLDGAFLTPEVPLAQALCDAVLFVHGSGSNFYRGLGGLPEELRKTGFPVAAFNNRGHDLAWGVPGNLRGNAFEILDRCRLDLDAQLGWLEEIGYNRIAIVGVSMGAVKSIYYAAHVADRRVAAIVPVSPNRLSYSYFMKSEAAQVFDETYKRAEALIAAGQPDAVFPTAFPLPHLWSAAAYVDKHNADERYNIERFIDKVTCPIFIAGGGLERHPRLRDGAADAFAIVAGDERNRLLIDPEADHGFPGKSAELASAITTWLLERAPLAALEGSKA
ncbi:MAG TPA: alpha/beta fold hydrolase [Dehalococcoidia bacterium]